MDDGDPPGETGDGSKYVVLDNSPDADTEALSADEIDRLVTEISTRFTQLLLSGGGGWEKEISQETLTDYRVRIVCADKSHYEFACKYTRIFTMLTTPRIVMSPPMMTMLRFQIEQLRVVQKDKSQENAAMYRMSLAMDKCARHL